MREVIEELRQALPPIFLGTRVDELTGGAIHWPTIQNKRSKREIPDNCFVKSGPKVLVRRDLFLDWWATTLSEARAAPVVTPRRGRRRARAEAAVGVKECLSAPARSTVEHRAAAEPRQAAEPPNPLGAAPHRR